VNGYGTISGGSGFYAHCLVWNPMGIEYWPDEPKMYPCLGGSLTRVCSKDAL